MTFLRRLALPLLLLLAACAGRAPDDLGVHDGRLSRCPDTPNCVSSMELRENYYVPPFDVAGDPDAAMDCLAALLGKQKRVEIRQRGENYIHAAASSKVFGFVDDVEFLLDRQHQVVHIRSAARMGYTDFGVNRERVRLLRQDFQRLCTGKES